MKFRIIAAAWLFLTVLNSFKAQTACVAILLNEYSATNVTGPTDAFGVHSDWVEIHNVFTSQVNLGTYYLSNDRNNLKKWKFPSNFVIDVDGYKVVWLSGKNTFYNGEYHTNFTLDQTKDQWLIITASDGSVEDSVKVLPAKADHTWGRVDCAGKGITFWRLYDVHSQLMVNPLVGNYTGYAPTPKLFLANDTSKNSKVTPQRGGFYAGAQTCYFKLNGITYDTASSCYDIFYTRNGNYPVPVYLSADSSQYFRYYDSLTPLTIDQTQVLRFIAVPSKRGACSVNELHSFCETNTYFVDPEYQTLKPDFGVISLAIDAKDTVWFNSQGNPPSTTLHVEYYDNKQQMTEGYAVMNRPVNEQWLTNQRGFYVGIEDRRGFGSAFEGRIFNLDTLGASTRTYFPTLHLKAGDIESHSPNSLAPTVSSGGTAVRDVFVQSLAARYNINVNPLHIKPVIAFLNGVYWGVFDLREVYDKYYESYYNGQNIDEVSMRYYHGSTDAFVNYTDGSKSEGTGNFRTEVYDKALKSPLSSPVNYNAVMANLDKSSFIDYMIMNSFFLNSDLWSNNVAYARGTTPGGKGYKWHYYLWNMPSTTVFTTIATTYPPINDIGTSFCLYMNKQVLVSRLGGNAHGNLFALLMGSYKGKEAWANNDFKLEFRNRLMDLLNGPLKCENLVKHYDYIFRLYKDEMRCQEDPCAKKESPFKTAKDLWDSNMVRFQRELSLRCYLGTKTFTQTGCFGIQGPFNLNVNVQPEGAGKVKLNSTILDQYPWNGLYFQTRLGFKAVPTSTTYAFHHWEFKSHVPQLAASMDTNYIDFARNEEVVAVFIDKTKGIVATGDQINVPTGFTPNGDNNNDFFRPLGAAEFATEYRMTIWNRWGEQVYESTDPMDRGWDGTYKGQQAITGVYAFVITYKNIYGENKTEKGNVTLTR